MEDLHRNLLLTVILRSQFRILDVQIFFDVLSREDDIVASTRSQVGHDHPVRDDGGDTGDEETESVGEFEGEIRDEFLDKVRDDED